MACKSTLVVESDADGKLVKWELRCEGKCKDKKQDCGTRVLDAGVLMYYCACNEQQEDEDVPKCRFQVYVTREEPIRTWAKCVGHCGKDKKEPCQPLVVKEYKVVQANHELELDLDHLKVHTVRHIVCGCHSEII